MPAARPIFKAFSGRYLLIGLILFGILSYGLSFAFRPFATYSFAGYTVRQNRITGMVQVQAGNQWFRFADDPYAAAIEAEDLKYIVVRDIAWGPDGLLCARLENIGTKPLQGRLALQLLLRGRKDTKIKRDRSYRMNVTLVPGQVQPFALDTDLPTPDTTKVVTRLRL